MVEVSKLSLVIIDHPLLCWSAPKVSETLMNVFGLKISGYGKEYKNCLPLDGTDFISTHIVICEEHDASLKPLLAYRSITSNRCKEYPQAGIEFPLISMLKHSKNSELHIDYVESLMRNAQRTGLDVRYCLSYTIDPEVRKDKILTRRLQEIMGGVHCQFIRSRPPHVSLLAGVTEFKVDRMFHSWGYEYAALNGERLGEFIVETIMGHPAALLKLDQFSAYALEAAAKYQALWNGRIEITPDLESIERRAA